MKIGISDRYYTMLCEVAHQRGCMPAPLARRWLERAIESEWAKQQTGPRPQVEPQLQEVEP